MGSLKWYLEYIQRFDTLTKEEEKKIILKAKSGDNKSYEELINRNLRFVVSIAKKYQNQGISLEDLIAEGNQGLVKAYKKFDPDRNVKFITYAVWWIRQSIMNCIHNNSQLIRLPWNKVVNIAKLNKLTEELEKEHGRQITIDELQSMIEDEKMFDDIKYQYTVIDLDKPQTANQKTLTEVIPAQDTDSKIIQKELRDEIEILLEEFTPREQDILKMYHGIGYTRCYTLKEIGIDMGLTRERIRQIKEKVFEKIRKKKNYENLKGYYNGL